jgi:hypothetical protein
MKLLHEMVVSSRRALGHRWHLPEYRQIELYTKRKKLSFAELPSVPADHDELPDTLGVRLASMLLEATLDATDTELFEGKTSWQKYLALPRRNQTDKLVAEVFRILRIFHIAATHATGRLESRDGLVRAACNFNRCALALNITPVGLTLLESFVFCYLDAFHQPYGGAYIEALLTQYFLDIVGEIRKFADEDRVLYQFRPKFPYFNRHARLDCDNPRFQVDDADYRFEIGESYADPVRYAIDFFLPLDDALYIVPVEALRDGRLPIAELPQWRSRTGAEPLPAHFRTRFGRELMVVGLPMT